MAKLIYSAIASLDGYIVDDDSRVDWVAPDEEVHTFFNDLERAASLSTTPPHPTRPRARHRP